jgi:hypothetical protein
MRSTYIILISLLSATMAAPQTLPIIGGLVGALGNILNSIPVLYASAPSFLLTKDPSPQCANVNGGVLLCCSSTFNGDMPLVVELAQLAGNFRLNPNSINGIYCKLPVRLFMD